MTTIDAIVREINRTLSPQFEELLRAALAERDRDWLVDQVVRLTLDSHRLQEIDRQSERAAKARARAERLCRRRLPATLSAIAGGACSRLSPDARALGTQLGELLGHSYRGGAADGVT